MRFTQSSILRKVYPDELPICYPRDEYIIDSGKHSLRRYLGDYYFDVCINDFDEVNQSREH